jgi:hypothetical protein
MPPCHHSWFPPIIFGFENQFRQKKKKKKKKPISQNRAWIIDDMLLWCCNNNNVLKFYPDNNKRTTLVVIPLMSTKEKRQKGSRLTCTSGTRFTLHPCWWGKRSTERLEEEKVENAFFGKFVIIDFTWSWRCKSSDSCNAPFNSSSRLSHMLASRFALSSLYTSC